MNFESDIDLLSQEEPCVLRSRGNGALSMATTTTRGRSLKRGRDKVHSTAAVISEVEKLEPREEMDTPTARGESGITPFKCGVGNDSKAKADERGRKVASYGHTR